MNYSESFLDNVKSFGVLGYSVEKIIDLTQPEDEQQFRIDFATKGSDVYKAYRKGLRTGAYNLDKDLFDKATKGHDTIANTLLDERKSKNNINDKIHENFGLL
ncbi:hypothetical protein D0T49_01935 [Paludibacter sp. 221]|uniref:hypothetical protein n=1 Tax=Paludibacter sp. 221 TaxID=2302939 RepID=UPI0013D884DC|nr:hypothetical protein [Paludibacter sp. 221]NDV45810.1 hypothetical protein [Paludibacter sp. 221]